MPEKSGAACACSHVRGGSGCDGVWVTQHPLAEQAGGEIRDALSDVCSPAMVPCGHAVGDDGGEQRFDCPEQRERDRVRQDRLIFSQLRCGSAGRGRSCGMPPNCDPMVSMGA